MSEVETGPAAGVELGARTGMEAAAVLREEVGRLVLGHPGVLRLEPTLLDVVQGLGQPAAPDGVQLATRGRVVDLDVNVATRADHQARASVLELHGQLLDLVAERGYVPGTVGISVLTIEETTDQVPSDGS